MASPITAANAYAKLARLADPSANPLSKGAGDSGGPRFGAMVKDARQGWALFAAMSAILLPLLFVCVSAEQAGNPALHGLAVDQAASALQSALTSGDDCPRLVRRTLNATPTAQAVRISSSFFITLSLLLVGYG